MRARFMSQHIAGGQFDPTQDVMAQFKALPASPHEVPPLAFFEQRVARAARRAAKKFQQHTTRSDYLLSFVLMFVTPFLSHSSALKAREQWIAQSSMFDLTQLFFVLAKEEGFASAKFEFTFAKGERERTK